MRILALAFAYLCIYTTPIQALFIVWQSWIIVNSDYTILSMSTKEFLLDNLTFLHDWIYSIFWNQFLDFVYQFPAIIMSLVKALLNTWLGLWILKKLGKPMATSTIPV